MIYDYLKTALPFVGSVNNQNRFLKPAGDLHYVNAPQNDLLPFIVQFDDVVDGALDDVRIFDSQGVLIWEAYGADFDSFHLDKVQGGKNYIWYYTGLSFSDNLAPQLYYLGVHYGGTWKYSEIFRVRCFDRGLPSEFLKLEWDNGGCDLPPILYQTGFKNELYLESEISKEAPIIEEEGTEDGDKNFIPTFQKYVENLVVETIAPLFTVEALVLMCMHRNVVLTIPQNIYASKIRDIKSSVTPLDGNHLYTVELRFSQDTQYINNACCEKIPLIVEGCDLTLEIVSITLEDSHPGQGFGYKATWTNSSAPLSAKVEYSLDDGVTWSEPDNYAFNGTFTEVEYLIELGQLSDLAHKVRITTYCQPGQIAPGTPDVADYTP